MAEPVKALNPSRRKAMMTRQRLRALVEYDPLTGIIRSKVARGWKVKPGDILGSLTKRGRIRVKIDYREYFAHQLAFIYMTDFCPEQIDHRDLDQGNNRWNNLRDADSSLNGGNKRKQQMPWKMASELKGVMRAKDGRWCSRICRLGKRTFLGVFDTEQEAHAAYARAALENFGEFARTE